MTTIVLAHPSERYPRFQVFAIYEAPNMHQAFGAQEFDARGDAERVARQMMETYQADHFRRVIEVGQRIG